MTVKVEKILNLKIKLKYIRNFLWKMLTVTESISAINICLKEMPRLRVKWDKTINICTYKI